MRGVSGGVKEKEGGKERGREGERGRGREKGRGGEGREVVKEMETWATKTKCLTGDEDEWWG